MVVYRRDCRRPFAPKNHWLVKDVKSSLLIMELERGRHSVQVNIITVPHTKTVFLTLVCFSFLLRHH